MKIADHNNPEREGESPLYQNYTPYIAKCK